MKKILDRMMFIRNTLKEDFPSICVDDINDILKFIYEEQIEKGQSIDSLETLENARYLCRLYEGNREVIVNKKDSSRVTIIREDDSYALVFKEAFKKLTEDEQALIFERTKNMGNIDVDFEYLRVVDILVESIKESDEYVAMLVENALLSDDKNEQFGRSR